MLAFHKILGEKQNVFFRKILIPSEKHIYEHISLKYQVMKILLNNLLHTLCSLIVRKKCQSGGRVRSFLKQILTLGLY